MGIFFSFFFFTSVILRIYFKPGKRTRNQHFDFLSSFSSVNCRFGNFFFFFVIVDKMISDFVKHR